LWRELIIYTKGDAHGGWYTGYRRRNKYQQTGKIYWCADVGRYFGGQLNAPMLHPDPA